MRKQGDPPQRERLSEAQRRMLQRVQPSYDKYCHYYPCRLLLKDGIWRERVYVVSEIEYTSMVRRAPHGISSYPEDDPSEWEVPIQDVVEIKESRFRMPVRFSEKIYREGESGMGYFIYTVVFSDGFRQAYATSYFNDFMQYPIGMTGRDIVDVLPHKGRNERTRPPVNFGWCLFYEPSVEPRPKGCLSFGRQP